MNVNAFNSLHSEFNLGQFAICRGFFYIVWTKEHSVLRQNVSAGAKFV